MLLSFDPRQRYRQQRGNLEYSDHEFSRYFSKIKSYASPFFNWVSGYGKKPSVGTSTAPAYPTAVTTSPQNAESQIVANAIAAGKKDENALTNLVFYRRHPELGGKPISKNLSNYNALVSEWMNIRSIVVRPLLTTTPVAGPVTPSRAPTAAGNISLQSILNAMQRKNYAVYTNPYQLNIVGVRSANAQANSFDDSINVFYKDGFDSWQFHSFPATTDPGTYYLNSPMNVNGTAIVVPGQYINSHKIGLHRGKYTALVQQGALKVIRDTNKDNTLDFGSTNIATGVFGINIHKAGANSTKVDNWSAGCQVFARSADFDAFIKLCQEHSKRYGNNFTYTLLEEKDLS